MNKTVAVYAGTFDPPTIGHLWMIMSGARLFKRLIVAIGVNPEKQCMFSVEERLAMLRGSVRHKPNVEVTSFSRQYLITYAQLVGAQFILRGIRSAGDYEYEHTMRNINGDIDPKITTLFLMPPRNFAEISSSMVKGLVGPDGWENVVCPYLPPLAFLKLKQAHYARTK